MKEKRMVMGAKEIAEELGICLPAVYALMKRGDFPVIRVSERRLSYRVTNFVNG